MDPLDSIAPGRNEWEAFRAQFGAALAMKWLVADIATLRPHYVRELAQRLESAGVDFDKLLSKGGDNDGDVPVTGPDWPDDLSVTRWVSRDELRLLTSALFPHGHKETDLGQALRCAVLVALHSAFELYAKSVGAHVNGKLPANVKAFFKRRGNSALLDSDSYVALQNADAVRHKIIHQAAIADDDFLRRANDSVLQRGERIAVSDRDLETWGNAMFGIAERLRRIAGPAV